MPPRKLAALQGSSHCLASSFAALMFPRRIDSKMERVNSLSKFYHDYKSTCRTKGKESPYHILWSQGFPLSRSRIRIQLRNIVSLFQPCTRLQTPLRVFNLFGSLSEVSRALWSRVTGRSNLFKPEPNRLFLTVNLVHQIT